MSAVENSLLIDVAPSPRHPSSFPPLPSPAPSSSVASHAAARPPQLGSVSRRWSETEWSDGAATTSTTPSRRKNTLKSKRHTFQPRPNQPPQLTEVDDHRPAEVKVRSKIAKFMHGNNYAKLTEAVNEAAEAGLPQSDPYVATARAVLNLNSLKRDVRNMCAAKRASNLPLLKKAAHTVASTTGGLEKRMAGSNSMSRVRKSREVQDGPAFRSFIHSVDCLEEDLQATAALKKNDIPLLETLLARAIANNNTHTAQRLDAVLRRLEPQYDWHAEFERRQEAKKIQEKQEQESRLKILQAEENSRKQEQAIVHQSWQQEKRERFERFRDASWELHKLGKEREWQRRSLEPRVKAARQGLQRCWVDNFGTKKPWTPNLTGTMALPHMYKRVECKRCNPVEWRMSYDDVQEEDVHEHLRMANRLNVLDRFYRQRAWEVINDHYPMVFSPVAPRPLSQAEYQSITYQI